MAHINELDYVDLTLRPHGSRREFTVRVKAADLNLAVHDTFIVTKVERLQPELFNDDPPCAQWNAEHPEDPVFWGEAVAVYELENDSQEVVVAHHPKMEVLMEAMQMAGIDDLLYFGLASR